MKDTSNDALSKLSKNYDKNRETWNFLIGIFFSVLSIFVSIVTAIYSPNNLIIAISVIGSQFFVLIMCIITIISILKNKKTIDKVISEKDTVVKIAEDQIKSSNERSEKNVHYCEKLLVYQKNINKRINNFLTLICDESDKYFRVVSLIREKSLLNENGDFSDNSKSQIEEERKKYKKALYNLFNRYIRGVVEDTLNIIRTYLKSRDILLDVSISLKLFNFTYHSGTDYKMTRIYTAFRDKETYDKAEREVGGRHYHIDLNGDFHKCLSKEWYIKNNIKDSSDDYLNENYPDSLRHYNCAVVVPIICDCKSDKQIYGFFCCDAQNKQKDVEVFDKNTATLLYATALTIGMFLDSLNSAWTYISDEKACDFLPYLHDEIYKGE